MKHTAQRRVQAFVFILLAFCITCTAGVFKGKIVNAETGEPLAGATIEGIVSPQPEWKLMSYAHADSTGCFFLKPSYEGRILITCSLIGFKNQRRVDYSYGRDVPDTTDLGTIRLQPTALMLQEVQVKAKLPRFTMKGDTIIFHPEAFKLKEGARLDELIKKLPGVYKQDGKYYWNDKEIRLTMNGKNLFGGDNIVGMLPADAAKNLKLYDRKSELAKHTGKDDGKEDHVLDIQVKPGFLDKWYGEIEGGYVTSDRYMGKLTASKLSDHDPQMVFAQINNINRYYDRTMSSDIDMNIANDGKSQYGSYNYQHNWNTKGTDEYDNNRFDVSLNLGHRDGLYGKESTTETYFPNTEHTISLNRNSTYTHYLTPQLQTSIFAYTDSVNTIDIKLKANYDKIRSTNESDAATYLYQPDHFAYYSLDDALAAQPNDALYQLLVTRNRNYSSTEKENKSLYLTYEWQHFLGDKGSYTLSGYSYIDGVENKTLTDRKLEYLRQGSHETLWQYYNAPTRNAQTMLSAAFEYWLTPKVYLKVSDQATYMRYHERRNIYADTEEGRIVDSMPTTQDLDNKKDNLLHQLNNKFSLQATISPNKKWMIMPRLDWSYLHEKSNFEYGDLNTTATKASHLFAPSIRMKWKISRERNMDLSFAYHSSAPSVTQTLPYRDTTDPLYIQMGNPNLYNSHSHVTTYNYQRLWLRQQISLGITASYQKDIHPITTLFGYNSTTGGYEAMPINVRGGDQLKLAINYDQSMGAYFRLSNQANVSTAQSYGYLTMVSTEQGMPELNHQRLFKIEDEINLAYEAEKLKVTLFNRLNYNRYRHSDASYNSTPIYDRYGFDAEWKIESLNIMAEIADEFRTGYQTAAMNKHRVIGTAQIEYRFLKNKCILALEANDIFNQDLYYESQTSAFQRKEIATEYFHHYLQLSFTYKFDAKAKKK